MHQTLILKRNILIVVIIACVIISGGLFLLHSAVASKQAIIANGLLADMILTFPIAYYFLIIRPYKIRNTALLLVFSCCCLVAYLTLPKQQQHYILQVRKLTVIAEIVLIIYVITKFKKISKIYKTKQSALPDFAYNLRASLCEEIGNVSAIKLLAAEITMLRYSLFISKKEKQLSEEHHKFTVHRDAGYIALFCVFMAVSMIEICGMHLLLVQHHKTIALITSLLSVYGVLFLVADISAIVKLPVLLTDTQLILRTGMRWRTITEVSNIQSVTEIKNDFNAPANCYTGAVIKSAVNVLVSFKETVEVERLYKSNITVNHILMSIDDVDKFKMLLNI